MMFDFAEQLRRADKETFELRERVKTLEVERKALIRVAQAAARHADDDAPDHQQTWRDLHDALATLPAGLLDATPTTPRTQSENQA